MSHAMGGFKKYQKPLFSNTFHSVPNEKYCHWALLKKSALELDGWSEKVKEIIEFLDSSISEKCIICKFTVMHSVYDTVFFSSASYLLIFKLAFADIIETTYTTEVAHREVDLKIDLEKLRNKIKNVSQ